MEAGYGTNDLLPAWVADMDFESPECVKRALTGYVNENIFGYYKVPDEYYEAFINWEEKYHNYRVEREWIRFAPGVVQAIYWILLSFTEKEDSIAIMNPVYHPFTNGIRETGRNLVDVPLVNNDGFYTIDFDLLEQTLSHKSVKFLLFCSPHNPVGRVWTEAELKRLLQICKKYNVRIIADEIHQDLVLIDRKNISLASMDASKKTVITLTSASKTFNLAGCQNAFAIFPDDEDRKKYDDFMKLLHVKDGNNFGYIAFTAAYKEGRPWLENLINKIRVNYHLLCDHLKMSLPKAFVSPLEGTYLVWVDLSEYFQGEDYSKFLIDKCKIAIDYGSMFGGNKYNDFIRINLATSSENIVELVHRLSLIKTKNQK